MIGVPHRLGGGGCKSHKEALFDDIIKSKWAYMYKMKQMNTQHNVSVYNVTLIKWSS